MRRLPDPTSPVPAVVAGEEHEVSAQAAYFLRRSHAPNTVRAYRSDWDDFSQWCATAAVVPLPATPATVANYLAALASSDGAKKNTVTRRLAAINKAHELAGHARPGAHPLVAELMRGIRRDLSGELDQAAPMVRDLLVRCIDALEGPPLRQARDRAVLCVGFAAALRRSELVAVDLADLRFVADDGVVLSIPVSKTDQERRGHVVALTPTREPLIDPVDAVTHWLRQAAITRGAVFRGVTTADRPRATRLTPAAVNTIVKRAVARVGLDPTPFSGHSLRAGFVTTARADGVPDHLIMATTRHRDPRTLGTYTRPDEVFENAARFAGW